MKRHDNCRGKGKKTMYGCFLLSCLFILGVSGCDEYHSPDGTNESCPVIYPDYSGVTFPINIAPPNFFIKEEGEAYQTEIGCQGGGTDILIQSSSPEVCISIKKWRALLKKSQEKNIFFRISVRQKGKWIRYTDIHDSISGCSIDPFLSYRLLYPGYELWNEMGIYQRNLTTYEQIAVMENKDFGKQCLNCHTFNGNSPQTMMLHVRGEQGGTLICHNGKVEKVNPKPQEYAHGATYPSWHPSGKYIAFSANEIQQFFHSSGQKPVEVLDLAADLMIYDVNNHLSFTDSLVYGNQYMETFPTWSPDGKTLYFCRADAWRQGVPLDSIYYDLYSVQFDSVQEKLHSLKCVYNASEHHRSVSFPRVSPDGNYLMFTQSDYGNFSIWHSESDLYLLDLSTGEAKSMTEVNSDDVESYHTWDSSGRWFVFSSKRMDGLWARPYFASFNPETGCFGKPFLLPQKNPAFYDTFTYTFNLPELMKEQIRNGSELLKAIGQPVQQAQNRKE